MGVGLDHRVAVSADDIIKGGTSSGSRPGATVGEPNSPLIMGSHIGRSIVCGGRMVAGFLVWRITVYWLRQSASLLGDIPIHARRIEGFHADTGNPGGMLEAAIHVAKQDPELAEIVKRALDA